MIVFLGEREEQTTTCIVFLGILHDTIPLVPIQPQFTEILVPIISHELNVLP